MTLTTLFVPNISGLNPKSLLKVYDMKAYVLLIAIRPSVEHVKPGGSLGAFDRIYRLMPAPGFLFTLPHLTFITYTLHQNTIIMHTRILHTFLYLQIHIVLHCDLLKWCRHKMVHTHASISSKVGPKSEVEKGRH